MFIINGLYSVSYTDRLKRLHLQSLELRRLVTDLIWCYKIVFGHVDVDIGDGLKIRPVSPSHVPEDMITNYIKVILPVHVVPFSVSVS